MPDETRDPMHGPIGELDRVWRALQSEPCDHEWYFPQEPDDMMLCRHCAAARPIVSPDDLDEDGFLRPPCTCGGFGDLDCPRHGDHGGLGDTKSETT